MAFISQHCRTPAAALPGLPEEDSILDISLNFDCDNLSDDVTDFLLAAAEHTKAPPVGLHDSDTILRNAVNKSLVCDHLRGFPSLILRWSEVTAPWTLRESGCSLPWVENLLAGFSFKHLVNYRDFATGILLIFVKTVMHLWLITTFYAQNPPIIQKGIY